ncbi:molecular chaperone SurA [Bordetella hinzii]|uniref:peptidylprolyl isomerase n=1 Tax=Bordetella hinzii TaxID=103855 RepID=UPI001C01DF41|nr:peptidylprolyl isomerase [Bordetella hinzii]QWF51109.1 molecular chaperone SurA [Bordetella hinzii]
MMRRLHSSRRFRGSLLALAMGLALPLAHAADKPAAGKPAPAKAPSASSEQFVDGIAAIVNKDVITMREVREGTARAKVDLQRRGIQLPDEKTLQKQVLQRLIFERLERQEADRLGIRVDDNQVNQAINMVASRNKITPQQLRAEVEKSGVSWDEYRKSLRDEIRTDRLRQRTIDNHIIITDAEVDAYLKDQARNSALQGAPAARAPAPEPQQAPPPQATGPVQVALAQILVRVPEGASPETVASLRKKAEDVLARLKRGDDFASVAAAASDGPEALQGGVMGARPLDGWPDLFVKAINGVAAGQVSAIVQSGNGFHILKVLQRSDGRAPARPQQRPAQAPAPAPAPAATRAPQGPVQVTQTHARHILIKTSTVMSDEQARQRLEQVRQRLVSGGAKFEDMARQYSQDATAPQGGDLGWVNPGEMVPSFEAAMNALKPGEISPPVESPFGWHLVQVLERREKDVTDEVQRMQARQALFERRAGPAFEDWMEQLRGQAFIDNRLEKQDRIEQNNR